jgi:hypothetical protein
VIEGFGENSLIIGEIVAAAVDADFKRDAESDDADLIASSPLLAYLSPGRFARIQGSNSFPYHTNFRL